MHRFLLCVLLPVLIARPAPPPRLSTAAPWFHSAQSGRFELDTTHTRIGFEADATLGSFRGTARKVSGWVESAQPGFADARGQIEVDAATFQTGIGMRDRHLRETLETGTHPFIRFVLDSARFESDSAGASWYRLHGKLTIRNVTRSPEIRARINASGDSIVVAGRVATRFTEFEMKPPSKMLGTAKVKDAFVITFNCTFRPRLVGAGVAQPPRPTFSSNASGRHER